METPTEATAAPTLCRDCKEPFLPRKRWGNHPGPYRRCEECRSNHQDRRAAERRLRGIKKKPTASYTAVLSFLSCQTKFDDGRRQLSDRQIAEGTGLSLATVKRAVKRLREESVLSVNVEYRKFSDHWITRRTIQLNVPASQKEPA